MMLIKYVEKNGMHWPFFFWSKILSYFWLKCWLMVISFDFLIKLSDYLATKKSMTCINIESFSKMLIFFWYNQYFKFLTQE
jgi:hypothetical protein